MALVFIAIDPETDTDHCPAVFVEEETGGTSSKTRWSAIRR